jgi:hypothetical protein
MMASHYRRTRPTEFQPRHGTISFRAKYLGFGSVQASLSYFSRATCIRSAACQARSTVSRKVHTSSYKSTIFWVLIDFAYVRGVYFFWSFASAGTGFMVVTPNRVVAALADTVRLPYSLQTPARYERTLQPYRWIQTIRVCRSAPTKQN